jgi:hypothetical protein
MNRKMLKNLALGALLAVAALQVTLLAVEVANAVPVIGRANGLF